MMVVLACKRSLTYEFFENMVDEIRTNEEGDEFRSQYRKSTDMVVVLCKWNYQSMFVKIIRQNI